MGDGDGRCAESVAGVDSSHGGVGDGAGEEGALTSMTQATRVLMVLVTAVVVVVLMMIMMVIVVMVMTTTHSYTHTHTHSTSPRLCTHQRHMSGHNLPVHNGSSGWQFPMGRSQSLWWFQCRSRGLRETHLPRPQRNRNSSTLHANGTQRITPIFSSGGPA